MVLPATGPMTGRTVLITGATRGIGLQTATRLARLGARVAITGRDPVRIEAGAGEIRAATGAEVDTFVADLSCQAEVRRLAQDALRRLPRVDVLINNVGGYWDTRRTTAEGFEHTFALNHLAPFLLTRLLLDRLAGSGDGRVVTVASNAHKQGRIDFDDLQGERSYSGARAYSQSKLANLLFTYELARRLGADGVTANAVHPGLVRTGFGAEDPSRVQRLLVPLVRGFMSTPEDGAAASVTVASAPAFTGRTGLYVTRNGARRSSRRSHDEETAARLWQVSNRLVGLSA